tara:strand:+ start:42706 stop:43875 length:1170 start_codon:yes stop_codon:yes gene_type:complete
MIKPYKHTGNIKAGLFIIGIMLIISLLAYTKNLIDGLRSDNREIVQLYAQIIANAVQDENDTNLDFVFDNIIKKVKFPIIQTDPENVPQMWKNLPEKIKNDSTEVLDYMQSMDIINDPIPLIYSDQNIDPFTFGYLHYGDSILIRKLQWWTYVELVSIGSFIFLGFSGFTFIRNNEKRHIWVGMAKETAHQLGTPVSALMGWVDWLKKNPEKTLEIIPEIEADLNRLEQIGRRFSRMGTDTEMSEFDLSKKITKVIDYLNKRLPSLGGKVKLINEIEPGILVAGNGSLLAWSIENIIRNGIDAIKRDDGKIIISMQKDSTGVIIEIHDNGCGIPRKDWRNIFRPGFSTKKTGWGLGLSLSTRIIEEIHRGKLIIEKSSPTHGTTFQIRL